MIIGGQLLARFSVSLCNYPLEYPGNISVSLCNYLLEYSPKFFKHTFFRSPLSPPVDIRNEFLRLFTCKKWYHTYKSDYREQS